MTTNLTPRPEVRGAIVGVDTHKHIHVAVAIDTCGIVVRRRFRRLSGPPHVGRDPRADPGVRHRRHRRLWRGPCACGPPSGASCCGSESSGPAPAPRAAIPLHTDPRSTRAKAHGVYRLLEDGCPGAIRGAPTGGVRPPPRAGLQTASWWAGARPYAVPRRSRRRDVAGRGTTHVRGDSSVRVPPPRVHWGAWCGRGPVVTVGASESARRAAHRYRSAH